MALDFGILQPANISGQLQAGQESAMRNQLAQQQLAAGQQQMETGRMQQEKAGLEMQQFRRRQSALDKFLSDAEKGGHTGDPEDVAKSFYDFAITSGDPSVVLAAQQALMAAKERKAYMTSRTPGAPAAGVPNALAPAGSEDRLGDFISQIEAKQNAPMPMPAVTGRPITPEVAAAPAANMLAPAPAAPAAPVNALAAPAPMAADPATALQNKIIDLQMRYPSGAAKAEIGMLTKQLEAVQKLHVVGDSLLNGAGQVVATVPKKATLSEFERILETSGLTPAQQTQAKQAWLRKQSTHAPGTSVTMVAEKAEAGAFGKMLVDQFADLSKSANLAVKTLPSIEANLSALNKGFDTGFGTETVAAGAKVLAALGVQNAEKLATDTQTFQSNAINGVLQKQLEQKGPQTESDARRIEQIGAELGKTKQANEFILATAKEQLKRDIEQRNFYAKWKEKTDSFKGAEDAWFAGEGAKSLFDRPGLKKYAVSTSAASMIPGQGSAAPAARTVVRTGTLNGRRVIQYSDGSTEYGN
jgi:hypothetical protein